MDKHREKDEGKLPSHLPRAANKCTGDDNYLCSFHWNTGTLQTIIHLSRWGFVSASVYVLSQSVVGVFLQKLHDNRKIARNEKNEHAKRANEHHTFILQ